MFAKCRVAWLGLLLVAALTLGCARSSSYSSIDHLRDYEGEKVAFKRFEQRPQRDFWTHWSRTAYCEPTSKTMSMLGADQLQVIEEHGKPSRVRKPFRSFEDQIIQEWIYLDSAKLYQFHRGNLVFEGPLTDYELTLLRRGYPDNAIQLHTESSPQTDIFVYHRLFRPSIENFKFSDGYLVQSKEGR